MRSSCFLRIAFCSELLQRLSGVAVTFQLPSRPEATFGTRYRLMTCYILGLEAWPGTPGMVTAIHANSRPNRLKSASSG